MAVTTAPGTTVTVRPPDAEESATRPDPREDEVVFDASGVEVAYSGAVAVTDVNLDVHAHGITALIGPSGCGKSTLLRSFNRMNDLVAGAEVRGKFLYHGQDLY